MLPDFQPHVQLQSSCQLLRINTLLTVSQIWNISAVMKVIWILKSLKWSTCWFDKDVHLILLNLGWECKENQETSFFRWPCDWSHSLTCDHVVSLAAWSVTMWLVMLPDLWSCDRSCHLTCDHVIGCALWSVIMWLVVLPDLWPCDWSLFLTCDHGIGLSAWPVTMWSASLPDLQPYDRSHCLTCDPYATHLSDQWHQVYLPDCWVFPCQWERSVLHCTALFVSSGHVIYIGKTKRSLAAKFRERLRVSRWRVHSSKASVQV